MASYAYKSETRIRTLIRIPRFSKLRVLSVLLFVVVVAAAVAFVLQSAV